MIQYKKRKNLDLFKYDNCIQNSLESRVYAFSWYLDIVADNWDVLVLNDYAAVMPIIWRKKFGIKYIYPPFWLLELGVFSVEEKTDIQPFFYYLKDNFRFIETPLNTDIKVENLEKYSLSKKMQVLPLTEDYNSVFKNYRKDRRKDLTKAKKLDLVERWNDKPSTLITLFKNNVGKRTPYIIDKDYDVLLKLIETCIDKRVGEIMSIYNKEGKIVASGFFLKHKKIVTILVSSTDFKDRKNGANTFLIDRAIYKYEKNFSVFNFGGSSMESIAKYFLSFGANTLNYHQIKYNKLPFLLRLFKK
ncbi:hypothetical protein [Polaribacter sp. Asnod1-A03]|uniref:hypothetical protein n=1 Tax=Polaribacter sp. Asnod1-A03 TaxID=3160581 RepID=UPI003865F16D